MFFWRSFFCPISVLGFIDILSIHICFQITGPSQDSLQYTLLNLLVLWRRLKLNNGWKLKLLLPLWTSANQSGRSLHSYVYNICGEDCERYTVAAAKHAAKTWIIARTVSFYILFSTHLFSPEIILNVFHIDSVTRCPIALIFIWEHLSDNFHQFLMNAKAITSQDILITRWKRSDVPWAMTSCIKVGCGQTDVALCHFLTNGSKWQSLVLHQRR